jgi:hypothetical protein
MKLRKFSELEAKMSPESRAWVQKEVQKTLTEMEIEEQRKARSRIGETTAAIAGVPVKA